MEPNKRRRPSHSMLVALLALSLAVSGSAIAADPLSKSDVKRIAKKQIKRQLRPPRVVNLSLNPGWSNSPNPDIGRARGYRDRFRVVHLAGLVFRVSGTESAALTLPPRFRPGFELELPAVCDEPGFSFDPRPGVVFIRTNGEVDPVTIPGSNCEERLSLDGITFRAGG